MLRAAAALLLLPALQADNPNYLRWWAFKPGARVVLQHEGESDGKKTSWTVSFKLVDMNDQRALVEITRSTTEADGSKKDLTEKVSLPARDPQATKPVYAGEQEIEVSGKKLKCRWTESTDEKKGTTRKTRTWYCDSVPGGLVRQEMEMSGAQKATLKVTAADWALK
jgi:hypothetical protein